MKRLGIPIVLLSLFAAAAVPLPITMVAQNCDMGCAVGESQPGTCPVADGYISGSILDTPVGNGTCKCPDGICEWKSDCNKTVTYTFFAKGSNVLCKDTTAYGQSEVVTLSVTKCGGRDAASFVVRDTDCTGTVKGTLIVKLTCGLCEEATCGS